MKKLLTSLFLSFWVTITLAQAQKITSVEGITEYRMPNGMKVLLFPDPSKQTITVNITYMVGSRHEGYGETGMAHLLEHLVFKGTPKHPNIPQELTSHGARPNGTTWLDRTNYYETFAATDENLNWALDLESDRMINSYIAKKDLETEMTVVRNEYESGENNPHRILRERITSSAFLWHNYGKSTIGARSDIEKVPIENLQAFYRNYYQPDNAILMVAGKIDEAKTLDLIIKKFGTIPKPSRILLPTHTDEPTQDGERQVSLRRVGDVQIAAVGYHIPSGRHSDFAACDIMVGLLTDEPSGRLYKSLVETKKAASIYGSNFSMKDPTLMYFGAEVLKEKSLEEVKNILIETIENYAKTAPTKEEVERIKTMELKNYETILNNSERLGLTLSESIGAGDWRLFFYSRDQIKKVTPEDIQRVAQKYLVGSNRTLGLFHPTEKPIRAEITEAPEVEVLLKDFKGGEAIAQGENFDPSPQNIDSRTKKIDLPTGIKMSFLSKKTRGNVVQSQLTFRYGDEKTLANKTFVADFMVDMLNKGTQKNTRQQLQDKLDQLKSRIKISGGVNQVSVSIETINKNFLPTLELVAEMLKESTFPADEFDKLGQEKIADNERQKSEPQAKASEALSQLTNQGLEKGHPLYRFTLEETLAGTKNVKVEEVRQFYKNFVGASDAILSVVGDFDEEMTKKTLTNLFMNWKSPQKFARLTREFQEISSQNQNLKTPDKPNAFFLAYQPLKLNQDDKDYPALVMANYILGGGFLNSRLATRIRQKEGLSYGVGSQLSGGTIDNSGSFISYAIYAPSNVQKLEAAYKEEIEKAVKEGFTSQELDDARKGYLQSRQVARSQDAQLAGTLALNHYLGRTMAWDTTFENAIKALTTLVLQETLKRHLDISKITLIKAGDWK